MNRHIGLKIVCVLGILLDGITTVLATNVGHSLVAGMTSVVILTDMGKTIGPIAVVVFALLYIALIVTETKHDD